MKGDREMEEGGEDGAGEKGRGGEERERAGGRGREGCAAAADRKETPQHVGKS